MQTCRSANRKEVDFDNLFVQEQRGQSGGGVTIAHSGAVTLTVRFIDRGGDILGKMGRKREKKQNYLSYGKTTPLLKI